MITKTIKRPWIKNHSQGKRYNPDPFYHSQLWKNTRKAHLLKHPFCEECKKQNILKAGEMVDHVKRIKEGGSKTDDNNLMTLCNHHHAVKSAKESNQLR